MHVQRLTWPGNAPDLNAIEKAWPWLKRTTTSNGAAASYNLMKRRWEHAWEELPQAQIQLWIEGIMANIQKVITLEGGNEYIEGRETKRAYRGLRQVGYLSRNCYRPTAQSDAATIGIDALINGPNDNDWEDVDDPGG